MNRKNIATPLFAVIAIAATVYVGLSANSQPAHAGFFDSLVTSDWETKSTEKYTIDVHGFDLRAYEWTPTTAPNTTCIVTFSQAGPVGMQCVPRK